MKNRLGKLIPLVIGIVAASGFYQSTAALRRTLKESHRHVPVLAASRHLALGEPLTSKNTVLLSIPAAGLPPAVLVSQKELLDENEEPIFRARGPFLKGEFLSRPRLKDKRVGVGLSWRVEKGKTASTFRFSYSGALAGLVQPGDWVGVHATLDAQDGWPRPKTVPLMSGVRVLGVGERLWEPWGETNPGSGSPASPGEDLFVTLSVAAEDAARLRLAEHRGSLHLFLLSPAHTGHPAGAGATLSSLNWRPHNEHP